MEEPSALIKKNALKSIIYDNQYFKTISLTAVHDIAAQFELPVKEVEITALAVKVIPERYMRSMGTVGGPAGQLALLRSRVAVIGLGGLGGLVAELLARMGVGTLVLVDGDTFNDSNLNRQVMATESELGVKKALAAAARLQQINAAVERVVYDCFATPYNLEKMLDGCQVAVDCLDGLNARFMLEDCCRSLKIPMVHGAIAQFYGQVSVLEPEGPGLESIYGPRDKGNDQGIEKELGNPASTPALVSSLQVQETLKILLEQGEPLYGRLLFIDTLRNSFEYIELAKG